MFVFQGCFSLTFIQLTASVSVHVVYFHPITAHRQAISAFCSCFETVTHTRQCSDGFVSTVTKLSLGQRMTWLLTISSFDGTSSFSTPSSARVDCSYPRWCNLVCVIEGVVLRRGCIHVSATPLCRVYWPNISSVLNDSSMKKPTWLTDEQPLSILLANDDLGMYFTVTEMFRNGTDCEDNMRGCFRTDNDELIAQQSSRNGVTLVVEDPRDNGKYQFEKPHKSRHLLIRLGGQ